MSAVHNTFLVLCLLVIVSIAAHGFSYSINKYNLLQNIKSDFCSVLFFSFTGEKEH